MILKQKYAQQIAKWTLAIATVACLLGSVCGERQQADEQRHLVEEMGQINRSLESLLGELAVIKREATGRLSQVRGKPVGGATSAGNEPADWERIRQTKVSRFVLKRVAELELESLGMRDEMSKLFQLQQTGSPSSSSPQSSLAGRTADSRQEDIDFDEPPTSGPQQASGSSAAPSPSGSGSSTTTTSSTTEQSTAEQQEAAQIGFDLEQLKRLGEEIGKRLDQFGKEAAKSLAELMEGIKLVFREPSKAATKSPKLRAGGEAANISSTTSMPPAGA